MRTCDYRSVASQRSVVHGLLLHNTIVRLYCCIKLKLCLAWLSIHHRNFIVCLWFPFARQLLCIRERPEGGARVRMWKEKKNPKDLVFTEPRYYRQINKRKAFHRKTESGSDTTDILFDRQKARTVKLMENTRLFVFSRQVCHLWQKRCWLSKNLSHTERGEMGL